MKDRLKLFVWENVLGGGVMFALAHDVEEARALILLHTPYVYAEELAQVPDIHEAPIAFVHYGDR